MLTITRCLALKLRSVMRRAFGTIRGDGPALCITADLNAVAQYVAKLPACNGKIVVAGFCWGGSESFRYAAANKDLKAAFVFYGTGPGDKRDIDRINCPVYGFYGGNDARVNATVSQSAKLMKDAGKTYEPVTYPAPVMASCAGEAPDANQANHKACPEAWQRWKDLLKKI